MIPSKRLQIFISSTFTDLIEERQAAVQAILSAGHIPAGMELFSAGDKSQMQVIQNWIEQSDIYLLILGGRYGSINEETGLSYIQLEYEYALNLGKPVFAVVINEQYLDEKVKKLGKGVIEQENYNKYLAFRKTVLSKIVKFFNDPKDIKIAIYETASEYSKRNDLIGWVPGNQNPDSSSVSKEFIRLSETNSQLKSELTELKEYYKEMKIKKLLNKRIGLTINAKINGEEISITSNEFDDGTVGEIFINLDDIGSSENMLLSCFSRAVSIALQYGATLEELYEEFCFVRFEPSGFVENHPSIKSCTSSIDFAFRALGHEYLHKKN